MWSRTDARFSATIRTSARRATLRHHCYRVSWSAFGLQAGRSSVSETDRGCCDSDASCRTRTRRRLAGTGGRPRRARACMRAGPSGSLNLFWASNQPGSPRPNHVGVGVLLGVIVFGTAGAAASILPRESAAAFAASIPIGFAFDAMAGWTAGVPPWPRPLSSKVQENCNFGAWRNQNGTRPAAGSPPPN
jgi:hypothetical protein